MYILESTASYPLPIDICHRCDMEEDSPVIDSWPFWFRIGHVARQPLTWLNDRMSLPEPDPSERSEHAVKQIVQAAQSAIEELGAVHRYAAEKFMATVATAHAQAHPGRMVSDERLRTVNSLDHLTAEYQLALLNFLSDAGREITVGMTAEKRSQEVGILVRRGIDQISEAYLTTYIEVLKGKE